MNEERSDVTTKPDNSGAGGERVGKLLDFAARVRVGEQLDRLDALSAQVGLIRERVVLLLDELGRLQADACSIAAALRKERDSAG